MYTVDTATTPKFLGLTDKGGLWSQLGGVNGAGNGGPGENVVIGVVDSGIWPESLSFSDRGGNNGGGNGTGAKLYPHPADLGWHGTCVSGEDFTPALCNNKLIGARYYNAGFGGDAGINAARPWEYNSPRDYQGHGTHTTSTAGGNAGVKATGAAAVFGSANGIAPRARVAMYKALWSTQAADTASGFGVDLVAAINQAVADGVDVINYSISGSQTNFADSVEIAFLFAARAGVFVATSAGNSGPAPVVAHPSPWITTVAAGTHDRAGFGTAVVNSVTYNGAAQAAPNVSGTLVDSVNVGLAPGSDAAKLCMLGALNPLLVAGKIVLCDRGVNARIEKSFEVLRAGGIGMILVNPSPNSLNADLHFVPTVHVADTSYVALHTAAGPGTASATVGGTLVYPAPAPFTAAFSSRGPLAAGGGDILKPDIMAPGVDVLAAVAPPGNRGRNFDLYSGTSMSSPHVAGLAALLKQAHPTWSPMAIKSALMTSSSQGNDYSPFNWGAGHVVPNSAVNPGLVYDSGFNDWLAFLCGASTAVSPATCTALAGMGFSFDRSDMNVPSIAIGDLPGTQTVKRRVTNVTGQTATFTSAVNMPGFDVVVTPSSLTLAPGETKSFTVQITTTSATLGAYSFGSQTWSGAGKNVRIPLVVRPLALSAPAQVTGTGGPINYNVVFGYSGPFSATPRGLIAATTTPGLVADDPADGNCTTFTAPTAFKIHVPVAIPAGTTYARFSLFDDFTDGADDIDLCVFRVDGPTNAGKILVGSSGSGTSAEEVNLSSPAAGDYIAVVHGWGTDGPDANYTLFHWLLGSADAGNMTVTAPATAVAGATGNIGLTFSGLLPSTKYLGSVAYGGGASIAAPTIVRVDTPAP